MFAAESDEMVTVNVRELTKEEYENEVMRMEESGNVYHSKEKSEYGNRAAELSGTVRSQFNATSKALKFLVKTRYGEIANEIGINTLNIQYNPGNNWVSLPGIHRYKTNSEQYYLEYEVSNISKGTASKGYLHTLCNKRWYYSSKIFKYRSIYCSIKFWAYREF